MKTKLTLSILTLLLAFSCCQIFAADFQYEGDTITVTAARADEPKVAAFNADTIRAAAKYLDDGALGWMQERSCVACHTTGAYMMERPALTKLLGPPSKEVLSLFQTTIPGKVPEPDKEGDLTYYRSAKRAVWRTAGLAEYDQHVTGTLSKETAKSLRDMLLMLSSHGGYHSWGQVEIPYNISDLEVSIQAIRAITAAPGWLANLQDTDLLARVEKLKAFLRETPARNNYERALRLKLHHLMPALVSKADADAAIAMLWRKQQPDGGWSTRRMAENNEWREPMTQRVLDYLNALPDAKDPGSDAYMTAFAIVLLRESGVSAKDERIQKAIAWLKREQRISGRWWMHSLFKGTLHFTTYLATAQALKALALCDEVPPLK